LELGLEWRMMKNIFNIMSAASFAGVLFMISMLAYVNITKASREERNMQYIQNVVDEAVRKQIVEMMPLQTGKVAK
jgi:hypothetical protein